MQVTEAFPPPDAASRRSLELVLVWATVLAAIADSVLTYIGLGWLGREEGSALTSALIQWFGLLYGLVLRSFIVFGLVWVVARGVTVDSLRLVGLWIVAVINIAVIGWNLGVMW